MHSNVVAYQGDSPADYVVEPLELVQANNRIRGDWDLANYHGNIWEKQEHDNHSNAVDYQGDSPSNYVVEPYADAELHNPPAPALAQFGRRI